MGASGTLNVSAGSQILEVNMKKLVLAAALTGVASFASAGSLEEPAMEPEVVIETVAEEASSSSNGLIIPLILVALIAAAS